MTKTYEIQTPTGQILEIEGPDDASEADLLAFAAASWKPDTSAGGGRGKTIDTAADGSRSYAAPAVQQMQRGQDVRTQNVIERVRAQQATAPTRTETYYDPMTGAAMGNTEVSTDTRSIDERRTPWEGRVTDADIPSMTVGSAARDIGAGVAKILPTAAAGVGQLGRLVSGDAFGKGLEEGANSINKWVDTNVGSERARMQATRMSQDMVDPAMGPADVLIGNPGALADQALPQLGSMILPAGVAVGAGKLAQAGNAAKLASAIDPASIALRAERARTVAVLGTTVGQNAADTFSKVRDDGGDLGDAYTGAISTAPFTVAASKLTGGGAEGNIVRAMQKGGVKAALKEGALGAVKAPLKEGFQETVEETGQIVGESVGTGKPIDPLNAQKRLAVAGTLGAAMGGGVQAGIGAIDLATSRGAPRVEDMPTTPVAPAVSPDVLAANQDGAKGLGGILKREGLTKSEAEKTTPAPAASADTGPAPAATTSPDISQGGQAPGPAPVGDQPKPQAALTNPTGDLPTAADPRTAALASIEKSLAESRARQVERIAQEAATAKAEADKVASTGSNYQQKTADIDQPVGAVPVPNQAQAIIDSAKQVSAKNSDLADQKTYPTTALYGIINSPDAGPQLLSAARTELERRKGNAPMPDISMRATSKLSPAAQSLQQRMRSGQNADNGTNTTTASTGLDSATGQSTGVQGSQRNNDELQARAGGQPVATAATQGRSGPAPSPARLAAPAPQAPIRVIEAARADMRNYRKVETEPVPTKALNPDQNFARRLANFYGRSVTFLRRTGGAKQNMPDGFVLKEGDRDIFIDADSNDGALFVTAHEIDHSLPEDLRTRMQEGIAAMATPEAAGEVLRQGYKQEDVPKELPAFIVQALTKRKDYWQALNDAAGDKDFAEFTKVILDKLDELVGALTGRQTPDNEFLRTALGSEKKIKEARDFVAGIHAEAIKRAGGGQATESSGKARGEPVYANKTDTATSEERQFKLDVERNDRVVGSRVTISESQVAAITSDANALGLNKGTIDKLIQEAKDTQKRFPPKAGWAPITAIGVTPELDDSGAVKLDKSGAPKVSVKWETISYGFNVPPGSARAPAKMDTQLVGKVADQFTRLVNGIYERAKAGDKNAQVIIGHQTWYRNVAAILRQEFGAQGDLFADLLGATSPNTPVDTNWRFAVEVLNRFTKGEFDTEMQAFIKHVDDGGTPSSFTGEKIRQASGKLYGMNSKNSMLALANLWRAVEKGTAPKARNFALNLIGQSNMATIDVWAARMLRRAAGNVRGSFLPRIPTVAEQGVTGTWNASTTAVTGEFGFGAAVLDKVSADLAKKGIDLAPPDLQALAWFAEKELWTENNWTSVQGEGGSFEERIADTPTSRYLMGFSVQQGDTQPEEGTVSTAQGRLLAQLRGDDTVISARVLPSYGMFMGKPEEAMDVEWTVKRDAHNPAMVMAEAAALAKENNQMAIFVSRVVAPDEENINARPGAEVYFKKDIGMDRVKAVMKAFQQKGLDGFTLAVDPRAKVTTRPGDEFIGLRIQYIPEFDEVSAEDVDAVMAERRDQLNDVVRELRLNGDVAFAAAYDYDTEVVSGENYDDYIDRALVDPDRAAGGQAWAERSVRERLERAASRIQSDAGTDGTGGVPSTGREPTYANKPEQGRSEQTGNRSGRSESRNLAPLEGAPSVPGFHGPDPRIVSVAEKYAADNRITLKRQSEYVQVDAARGARIASAYEDMAHDPQDPAVKEAYENLIKQTTAQYKALVGAGYKFHFIDLNSQGGQDYASTPWNAMRDTRENQRMGVFSTEAGFGSAEDFNPEANPLLAETGFEWPMGGEGGPGQRVLANDLFRAVHDAFGHGMEGAGFRAQGEENAWQAHVRLFTGSAIGAITSETRGQNSWLNFGPYGEANRTAKVEDTHFADQKTGLMPAWTWAEGRAGDSEPTFANKPTLQPLEPADILTPEIIREVEVAIAKYKKPQNKKDLLTPYQRAIADRKLKPLLDAAERNKTNFDAFLNQIASSIGSYAKVPGIKGAERAGEKLMLENRGDATEMKDLLRGTIAVRDMAEANEVIKAIGEKYTFDRIKNRFEEGLQNPDGSAVKFKAMNTGYRDILTNVVLEDGTVAEIQISTPELLAAKNQGHKVYGFEREMPNGVSKADMVGLQIRLYAQAANGAGLKPVDSQRAAMADRNASKSSLSVSPAFSRTSEGLQDLSPSGKAMNATDSLASVTTGLSSQSKNRASEGSLSKSNSISTSDSIVTDGPVFANKPTRSPYRDAAGRGKLPPGVVAYKLLGKAARPFVDKMLLTSASPETRRELRQMKLDVQKAMDTTTEIAREVSKMSPDERKMISDVVENEVKAGITPSANAVQTAAMMNDAFETQTDELVRLGMLTQDAADRWRGKYLPRYYESKLKKPESEAWADVFGVVSSRPRIIAGIKGSNLKSRGKTYTVYAKDIADWEAKGWEVRDTSYKPGDKTVQIWRDFTPKEREKMGEIRDAGFRFVMGYMQTQKDIALGRMYERVSENDQMASKTPLGDDWIQVPDTKIPETGAMRYGKLASMYVPKDMMLQLSNFAQTEGDFMRVYKKALSLWKEGKALALDTPIPTPNGWTTMGDLEEGDVIFDESGYPCEVTFSTPVQYDRTCYEVEFSDGEKIVADAEHLWFTLDQGRPGVRTTEQVLSTLKYGGERQYNAHSVPVAGALKLPDIELPVHPYFLGVWLGDGSSRNSAVTSSTEDAITIQAKLQTLGFGIGAQRKDPRGDAITYTVGFGGYRKRTDLLAPTLNRMGLRCNKHIPPSYLRASEWQRMALLQGLMDTDGHIDDAGKVSFCTASERLRDDFIELARSLGFKPRATMKEVITSSGVICTAWNVRFHATAERPVFSLPRKAARLSRRGLLTRPRSGTRQIVAITPVPSVPVKCIQVSSESRLYLAGRGMIPTHNTVLNPVSHVNNFVSNATMAHFAGVSYWDTHKYAGTVKDLAQGLKNPMVKEAREAGLFLGSFTDEEINKLMPPELQSLLTQQDSKGTAAAKLAYNVLTWGLRKPMQKAYEFGDSFYKYMLYKDARNRGASPEDAVEHAQSFIFTYDDLPTGARRIRDFGMPFFSYTYKAVPKLAEVALTRPDRFLAPAAVIFAAGAIGYAAAAGGDDDWMESIKRYLTDADFRKKADQLKDDEYKLLPEWMKGHTAFGTLKQIRMGSDKETGNPVFLDVSRFIPGGDLFDINANAGGVPLLSPITPSNPLLSLYSAMIANKDPFFGKDLVKSTDSGVEAAKKRADYLWKMASPAVAAGNIHWDRATNAVANALGGEIPYLPDALGGSNTGVGKDGQPVQAGYAALQTVGIKARPMDMEMSEQIQGSQKAKTLRDLEAELKQAKRYNNKGVLSDRMLEKKETDIRQKIDNVKEGLTVSGFEKD